MDICPVCNNTLERKRDVYWCRNCRDHYDPDFAARHNLKHVSTTLDEETKKAVNLVRPGAN
jgi:predicted amidophosphoribosyltransferase